MKGGKGTIMKIVVLDGYTLNPGDLDWDGLEVLGDCTVYDRTPPELVAERAAGAEVVLINKVVLDRRTIEDLPQLRCIGVLATGVNVVDLEAARQRGIPVTNVPAYSTASVAQMVFALLLEMTQQVGHHAREVAAGRWSECADFCFYDRPLVELEGLVMGLVGFGQIARAVARLAEAFGMSVLVHTRNPEKYRDQATDRLAFVDLETLFAQSDVVSLHCPLTPETERLVSRERLAAMKPSAYLVNTGRGPLVDEEALADALNSGRLAGAGLDVLSSEPPPASNPLLGAKNVFVAPHIAWATTAARRRLMETAVGNVEAFASGCPRNVVNGL